MNNLGSTDAIGRVIAEMDPRKIDINSSQNFVLEAGDTIFMPKIPNTVTIVGEVLSPITAPYNPRYSKTDYIKLAGGFKESANASKSYILLPNGKSLQGGNGLSRFIGSEILPGSTIIVQERLDLSGLSFAEAISPILANLSITMASINSISNN